MKEQVFQLHMLKKMEFKWSKLNTGKCFSCGLEETLLIQIHDTEIHTEIHTITSKFIAVKHTLSVIFPQNIHLTSVINIF